MKLDDVVLLKAIAAALAPAVLLGVLTHGGESYAARGGIVCALDGMPIPDLIVVGANQERGIVAPRPGSGASAPDLPVGARLRVLPNHACATAAQYDQYQVVRDGSVVAEWSRFSGW